MATEEEKHVEVRMNDALKNKSIDVNDDMMQPSRCRRVERASSEGGQILKGSSVIGFAGYMTNQDSRN